MNRIIKAIVIALLIAIVVLYIIFWVDGRKTYLIMSTRVNFIIREYPPLFETIFDDIFLSALNCKGESASCVSQTRAKFDTLSDSLPAINEGESDYFYKKLNNQPMYFLRLLPSDDLAKLFFSGDLILEKVDNREEKMVASLLKGKRKTLYGPYLGEEVFWDNGKDRRFYDLKPNYLKDLYSQMEVIVPYYQKGNIAGAIVYLHGQ